MIRRIMSGGVFALNKSKGGVTNFDFVMSICGDEIMFVDASERYRQIYRIFQNRIRGKDVAAFLNDKNFEKLWEGVSKCLTNFGKAAYLDEIGEEKYVKVGLEVNKRRGKTIKIGGRLQDVESGTNNSKNIEFYSELIERIPTPIYCIDINRRYVLCNKAFEVIVGREKSEIVGKKVDEIKTFEILESKAAYHCEKKDDLSLIEYDSMLRINSGELKDYVFHKSACYDSEGVPEMIVCILTDITPIKNNERKLRELIIHDELTGLYNRRGLWQMGEMQWKSMYRQKEFISFLVIDIDRFKEFNDSYGHLMGDKIIKKISESIKVACNRASDIAARFGGDEFVVILPQCSLEGAYKVGSSIRRAVEEVSAYFRDIISERITVSIGVFSDIPNDANSLHYCIERADRNLYVAKSIGGNIVSIDEAM